MEVRAPTAMYRHFIAPPRAFTQFSHDLIRHPRLPSDTVRSLTWQLSLPEGARESLSRTAERARTGACAFTRAKRQLKEEGFVHERRVQGPGGHWVTQQLVSTTPLSAAEAAELLARTSVGAPSTPVSPQVAPRPRVPAAGDPAPSPTGGRPGKDPRENTSHRPVAEPDAPAPAPEAAGVPGAARALVAALPRLSPELHRVPRGMQDELARLVSAWPAADHTPAAVHLHVLRGLPDDGAPVHRPGGLLRYLLRDVPSAPDPGSMPGTTASRSVSEPSGPLRPLRPPPPVQPTHRPP
ncbi:predicted protein [Streptomyces viridosporus ATCC 14672]|uniref:Predicted protein n=3 Tax=Streptomyces viridosporus TaxID=67581 RepID=D6A3B6_STRV1|nr:predicted protein [Streptomyces viridosporus ATCC 14672]